MSTSTMPPGPAQKPRRPSLPSGLRWSNVWKVDGQFVESPDPAVELPVDQRWEIAGKMWACPVGDCRHTDWTFEPTAVEDAACCPKHPNRLIPAPLDGAVDNPVEEARGRVHAWAQGVYERRRLAAQQAVQARIDAAQKAVEDAARRTAADMRGHVPSIAASVSVLAPGMWLALADTPLAVLVGAGLASVGAVAGYVVAYLTRRLMAADRADVKRQAKDRRTARHVASGVLASGLWLVAAAPLALLPVAGQAILTLLVGFLLMFAVNNAQWQRLWAERHRLKDMARRKAEAEAARLAAQPEPAAPAAAPAGPDSSDPQVVGERMAAEWARIAGSQAAGTAFPQMARTWIVVSETQPLTAPIDGELVRIGWEFYGQSEPGALVAGRGAGSPPIVAAKDWLAAVLFDGAHNPANVSLVDRPGGAANRFTLMVTDKAPLGAAVRWQGKAGVKRLPNGTVLVHRGQSIDGKDVHHPLYVPGQAFGGLVVGTRGGGKTAGTILYLLNCLAGGVFPVLFDPKQLVDYADFIGVFPIGITQAHRDVITDWLIAERKRRERLMARRPVLDEFGRQVHGESMWDLADGPPISHNWEEFHDLAQDEEWVTKRITNHIRFERAVLMGGRFVTQGGGLADLSNSVLRGLLNQTELTTYRMDDHQARLAGRKDGTYTASDLPPLPGMCLVTAPEAAPLPMRDAFVPRKLNDPDSVFNQLYGRSADKVLQLPLPVVPEPMLSTMRRTGLQELWQRAQGEDGLDRLLSDAEDEEYGGPSPVPAGAGGLAAAQVLQAIVLQRPGCPRAHIDTHPVWSNPAAGGKVPALSTISRAANALEKAGRIRRDDGHYWVAKAGEGEARQAASVLGLTVKDADDSEEQGDE